VHKTWLESLKGTYYSESLGNMKMDPSDIWFVAVDWIDLPQDRD
jgi:hypothetical protein